MIFHKKPWFATMACRPVRHIRSSMCVKVDVISVFEESKTAYSTSLTENSRLQCDLAAAHKALPASWC